ncbi:hypothetical protein DFS33DRAFT_242119 [Desarmillaria ectypa]|nr:hypothetical protein DFS33DRAFT_242119 [Desarmillaria ectypa]
MGPPFLCSHSGEDLEELIHAAWWEASDEYLKASSIAPSFRDPFCFLNHGDEYPCASGSNCTAGANHLSFEHTILTTTPNIVSFDRTESTEMDADSMFHGTSTAASTSDSFVPLQPQSYIRPYAVSPASYYMPSQDRYTVASSSQTFLREIFHRDKLPASPSSSIILNSTALSVSDCLQTRTPRDDLVLRTKLEISPINRELLVHKSQDGIPHRRPS